MSDCIISTGSCTDSPVIATLCGSEERVVEDSSGLYILIEFYTDYSVTYRGFELEFYIGIQLHVQSINIMHFIWTLKES